VAQKKVRGFALEPRRQLISPEANLSLSKQCELLGVGRSGWYYQPRGESAENLALMRALDELYTRWPFYGVRRMTLALQAQGWAVNPKRTRRLMRLMGLEAIYPKPRLSGNGGAHPRFPYLLKGLAIERSNQVWCSDITYIGLAGGFVYLFALMDWFSRYVLAWELAQQLGKRLLRARPPAGVAKVRAAPDQQHRSRGAVYQRQLDQRLNPAPDRHQHGWPRPGLR
jgi:putative transposase